MHSSMVADAGRERGPDSPSGRHHRSRAVRRRPGARMAERSVPNDGRMGGCGPLWDVSAMARSPTDEANGGWMAASAAGSGDLTAYEAGRVAQIRGWYGRAPGLADRVLSGVSDRARWMTDRLLETPRVRRAVEDASGRVLEALDGQLLRHVDPPTVGLVGPTASGRRGRGLQRADEEAARLHTRYVGGLSAQAAVAGAASLTPVMAVVAVAGDVALALLGSLRTAAHILSVYGSPTDDGRLVPASVGLVAVASETDPSRRRQLIRAVMATVTGQDPTRPMGEEEVVRLAAQQTGSRTVKEAVEQMLRRTVRRRAVALVPVVGAVASASASGWLVSRVSEAARNTGTVRFLHEHAQVPADTLLGDGDRMPVT